MKENLKKKNAVSKGWFSLDTAIILTNFTNFVLNSKDSNFNKT